MTYTAKGMSQQGVLFEAVNNFSPKHKLKYRSKSSKVFGHKNHFEQ